jgi:hypothetical protein
LKYCEAKRKRNRAEFVYWSYMTDALKVAYDLNIRWSDLITDNRKIETRTAEEIKDTIKGKLRSLRHGFV